MTVTNLKDKSTATVKSLSLINDVLAMKTSDNKYVEINVTKICFCNGSNFMIQNNGTYEYMLHDVPEEWIVYFNYAYKVIRLSEQL